MCASEYRQSYARISDTPSYMRRPTPAAPLRFGSTMLWSPDFRPSQRPLAGSYPKAPPRSQLRGPPPCAASRLASMTSRSLRMMRLALPAPTPRLRLILASIQRLSQRDTPLCPAGGRERRQRGRQDICDHRLGTYRVRPTPPTRHARMERGREEAGRRPTRSADACIRERQRRAAAEATTFPAASGRAGR